MANENKTYTTIGEVKGLVDKVNTADTETLKTITNGVVQMIRDKHL
jgi:hypothetical protein